MDTYTGTCFCGAVAIEVVGSPEGMGYCHCDSCRAWSASPVNAFSLWKPDAVKVTRGADRLASFTKSANSVRQYCSVCAGHMMTGHPVWGLVDVYAALLPGLKFVPGLHVNYTQTVLPMRDGLPKYRDFPTALGGTGETMPE
ncbi:MAG: GFA family protein [Cucumibacter sp.]